MERHLLYASEAHMYCSFDQHASNTEYLFLELSYCYIWCIYSTLLHLKTSKVLTPDVLYHSIDVNNVFTYFNISLKLIFVPLFCSFLFLELTF